MWYEQPDTYDFDAYPINTQFVDMFFIDVETDPASLGDLSVDVRVPYSRVNLTTGEEFTTAVNHMVCTEGP